MIIQRGALRKPLLRALRQRARVVSVCHAIGEVSGVYTQGVDLRSVQLPRELSRKLSRKCLRLRNYPKLLRRRRERTTVAKERRERRHCLVQGGRGLVIQRSLRPRELTVSWVPGLGWKEQAVTQGRILALVTSGRMH